MIGRSLLKVQVEIHKEVKKRKTKHKVRGPDDGHGSYPATAYTGMKRMLPDIDE